MGRKRTAEDIAREEQEREHDLAFLAEVRTATRQELQALARNLNFGAPAWQKIAVKRALERVKAG